MNTTKNEQITIRFSDDFGINVSRQIRVVTDGYTLYFNCQHLLIQLGTEARCFFDYLCERMKSDTNEIKVDAAFKTDFITHISKITSKKVTPAVNSLNKYVSTFKELGLIIPTLNKQREYYAVNPRYAYKGQKKQRLQLLKDMITERIKNKLSLKGLIDIPEKELGIQYSGIQ